MRLTVISLIFTVLFAAFIVGCSRKPSEQPPPVETKETAPPEGAEAPPGDVAAPPEAGKQPEETAEAVRRRLLNPSMMNERAPDTFRARFTTSKGDFVMEVTRAWAPNGADRFYNLVKNGYYDDCRFFRVLDDFMVQFGINGDPAFNRVWSQAQFNDDPVRQSNQRGYVSFAMSGQPNSRTTQIFINYKDNSFLDADRFAPFGRVIEGMSVVDSLFNGYRGTPSDNNNQQRIQSQGNAYLNKEFPRLDYIKSASII